MKKTILIIAEYIGEDHNSTAYYWSQIVRQLKVKYNVILITPKNSHSINFVEKYNIEIRYIKQIEYNKNNLFSRLIGQCNQTISFIKGLKKELDTVDLIFSGTNPIVTMGGISILKKFYSFKWLVLVHDLFPNNLVPAKVIKGSSLVYSFLNFCSNKMYSSPDQMISIGRDMASLLSLKTNNKKHNIHYIPNWASTKKILPTNKCDNEILLKLGWESEIVFQFFGNMGRLQGIENLLNAISISKHLNARFLFIGSGSELTRVKDKIDEINTYSGFEKIHYLGKLNLEKNHIGLNACDLSLVTLSSNMYGLGVPSKAYFSMAANKPILYVGDPKSELDLLLSEHDLGWSCIPDKPNKLAELIDKITEHLIKKDHKNKNPRKILTEYLSEENALIKIEEVVNSTLSYAK